MPRLHDDFIHCVLYVYPTAADADASAKTGGSGFFVGVPPGGGSRNHAIYAVTNRHVVEAGGTVLRVNTSDGLRKVVEIPKEHWHFHPSGDDVAVCRYDVDIGDSIKFLSTSEHLLTKDVVTSFNVGVGDDVFMSGRFKHHEGHERNLPTMRFGNIAQMPFAPVIQRHRDREFEQESFLVEARSQAGYSGAAVFLGIAPGFRRHMGKNAPAQTDEAWLLGIGWGHLLDSLPVLDQRGEKLPDGYKVLANSGMMAVVPAWKLTELLNIDVLVFERGGVRC